MDEKRVGLLGATSLVGEYLLPMLTSAGWLATPFSRGATDQPTGKMTWEKICPSSLKPILIDDEKILYWICVAPIWVLPDYFGVMYSHGARRIVALSSTSRFTKNDSSDLEEQAIARRLADAEKRFRTWAESKSIEWVILRPTLIYGRGRDKNISEIARAIRRIGFFPLFGAANGLRQPVHAEDVASVCVTALQVPAAANWGYTISGGETVTYRNMVTRVFAALGRRPRFLRAPLWVFRLALAVLRRLPRYRQYSTAMAERMNRDLVFDHVEATRDLGFKPRPFVLTAEDLPT